MAKLFSDIAGQKKAVGVLTSHLERGGLSHAYLFLGKEGTGKEYLAKEFARYIMCPQNTDDDCEGCRKVATGAHPDFIYVDGRDGVKIEQVRGAIERIGLSPVLSRKKVCLITGAENMGIEAANALLKTLEEPPLDSILILTSSSEKKLPATIISRSQLIKLNPISEDDIVKILEKEFSTDEVASIVALSEGSLGEAKRLLLDGDALEDKKSILKDINDLLNSKSLVDRFKILESYEKKKRLREFYDYFTRAIFDSIYAGGVGKRVGISDALPKTISVKRKIFLAKKILKIYANLNYNVSLRFAMDEMMIKDQQSA